MVPMEEGRIGSLCSLDADLHSSTARKGMAIDSLGASEEGHRF